MRALTVHQPHASLIALGIKTIETRSWSTSYRGRLAIHAAAKDTDREMDLHPEPWRALGDHIGGAAPVRGAVVATAELVDCVPITNDPADTFPFVLKLYDLWLVHRAAAPERISDQLPYGDFRPGRWAWLLDDIKSTAERCPACWGNRDRIEWIQGRPLWGACVTCDGAGSCDPIPARGRQGLWEWVA